MAPPNAARFVTAPLFVASIFASGAAGAQAAPPAPATVPAAGTEAAPPRKMTLDEALAFARSHHARILAAKQRLEAARRDAEVPSAQWLPRVGAFAELVGSTANNSTTTLINQPTVDVPRVGATKVQGAADWQPYPSTAVALGVRQELYDFGRIAAERAAAELASEVEKYRVASAALDVDFSVAQAYYAVLAAAAIESASRAAYERAVQHRDVSRANVQSGLRPPIELTRAEADVARYEAGMTRSRGSLHVARSVFAAATGVDDVELDAAGASGEAKPLTPLADLVGRANGSPLVLEGRARVDAQKAETARLEAQARPNVFATASATSRAGGAAPSAGPIPDGNGWLPVVPNYSAGVVLSWPIFEPGWSRRADASRAREQALGFETDLALRNTRSAISAAWHEADVATQTLAALQRGADAAKANYDQAENRFRVGLGTATELADAQAVRTEADIQLAIGTFQMARARAALARAAAEVR
jgi:outer membrane protein TolC